MNDRILTTAESNRIYRLRLIEDSCDRQMEQSGHTAETLAAAQARQKLATDEIAAIYRAAEKRNAEAQEAKYNHMALLS